MASDKEKKDKVRSTGTKHGLRQQASKSKLHEILTELNFILFGTRNFRTHSQ